MNDSQDHDDRIAKLPLDAVVAHLESGYANSQSVARFLDTKAAACIGFAPLILAYALSLYAWIIDDSLYEALAENLTPCGILAANIIGLCPLFFLVYYVYQSLRYAFSCLIPRDTGDAKPSTLFPYSSSGFDDRLRLMCGDPDREDLLEDYRRQIERMAVIAKTKLIAANRSIKYLQRVLVSALAITVLAVAITVWHISVS